MSRAPDSTLWRRVAVTAGVLAAYCLGSNVLLPGLDDARLRPLLQSGNLASDRLSIFALGVMPVVNALLLIEIAKLVAPGLRRWELAAPANGARLGQIAVGLALLMALVQAAGYATALEGVSGLVADPGTPFRAICIVTLIGSTALLVAFAALIDRAGVGSGLWLLFLAPALTALPGTLAAIAEVTANGSYATGTVLLTAAFSVLAVAGVVGIVRAADAAPSTIATCIWAPLIANTVGTLALIALQRLASSASIDAWAVGTAGHLAWYAAAAAIIVGFVVLYQHAYAGAGQQSPVGSMQMAGTLAAIYVAGAMLQVELQALLPLSSAELIIAAAVATAMLIRWGGTGASAAAEPVSPRA